MFKKLTAIAILVISIPVMAYAGAWSLNTWARSAGGTISVNGGTAQSVTNGSQFANYTGGETVAVTITPAAGYTVKYFLDQIGNTSSETPDGTTGGTINITQANATLTGSVASLWAVFHATTISVTAAGDANSTVNMTSIPFVYPGSVATRDMVFTFTATPGYIITGITNAPVLGTPGITVTGTGTATAKVTIQKNYMFSSGVTYSFDATSAASTTLTTPNAGAAQAVVNGATATLTGTYVGPAPAFQNWSCVAKPTGATQPFAKTSAASVVIPAAVLTTNGTYVFQYRVSDTSRALTSIQVTATAPAAKTQLTEGRTCQACHTANGIATSTPTIYASYSASAHHLPGTSAYAPYCSSCHLGTATGGHPGTLNANTVNSTNFIVKLGTQTASEGSAAQGAVFCTACHNGAHPIPHATTPASCVACHSTSGTGDAHTLQPSTYSFTTAPCNTCHTATTINGGTVYATSSDCVGCHNVGIQHVGSFVNDNTGVRAITGANGEFEAASRLNAGGFRSHHIYNGSGVDPQNAQCIACHLEGKVGPGQTVVIDSSYHMSDAKVHLRSGNTAIAADFAWDPQNPDHSGMDNFCMSCHNAAGAVSAYANMSSALHGMTAIPGALALSPKNPFGDLLKNAYDGLQRPQVVAVYEQFDTGNAAHHAVRGKKYTGAYRAGNPNNVTTTGHAASTGNFTQYSGATIGNIHITAATGIPNVEQYFGTYSSAGPAAGFDGGKSSGSRKTLYEASLFVASYTTLDGATIGDDSTLHCGDCHSVGQWKSGSANAVVFNNISNAQFGYTIQPTTKVIGAHGSQNEYMLRTSNGSDALHTQGSTAKSSGVAPNIVYRASSNGTYVCYLCHKQEAYGDNNYFRSDAGVGVTSFRDHAGLHYNNGCDSSAQQTVGKVGYANRIGVIGSGKLGTAFGYTCAHCHSSGERVFGGIHGNATADGSAKNITFISYSTDGTDIIGATLPGGYSTRSYNTEHDTLKVVARLPYRFMGGTGLRYNGGATASKWEAKTLNGKHREGCYNLPATAAGTTTNLWNTTNPQQTLANGPGGNAIVNNGGNDDAVPSAGNYANRALTNNGTAGWGACNHHQGSTTTGSTAPTRSVQRPLVY